MAILTDRELKKAIEEKELEISPLPKKLNLRVLI